MTNEKQFLKLEHKSKNRILFRKSDNFAYIAFMPSALSSRMGFMSTRVDDDFLTTKFKEIIEATIKEYIDNFGSEHHTESWKEDKVTVFGAEISIKHDPERDLELIPNEVFDELNLEERNKLMEYKRIDISLFLEYSKPWTMYAKFSFNDDNDLNFMKAVELTNLDEKPFWSIISLLTPKVDSVKSHFQSHVFFGPRNSEDYFLVLRVPNLDFIQEANQILSRLGLR